VHEDISDGAAPAATFTCASADAGAAVSVKRHSIRTHRGMNPTRSNIVRPTVRARIVRAARFAGLKKFFGPDHLGLATARPRLLSSRPLRGLIGWNVV
jgi:hypothetical protein